MMNKKDPQHELMMQLFKKRDELLEAERQIEAVLKQFDDIMATTMHVKVSVEIPPPCIGLDPNIILMDTKRNLIAEIAKMFEENDLRGAYRDGNNLSIDLLIFKNGTQLIV